jgi:fatty-acyl-CoA synthase
MSNRSHPDERANGRKTRLYNLNLTESHFPAQGDDVLLETTVGGLLRDMADKRPDAEALVEVDMQGECRRRWTYRDLLEDSEKLGIALASRFEKGERITVWAPNIPEWVLLEYACAFAGLVLVTANPAYQPAELRYVLEQSGSVALFLVPEYRDNPMADIAAKAIDGLDSIRETVNMEDAAALFEIAGDQPSLPDVEPGDPAQIQYTSGTTGFPKGAVLSHRSLTNNARLYAKRARADRNSVWANFMPMFHTAGCGMITLGALQSGCKMLIVKLFEPGAVLRLMENEKVTGMLGVPTMIVALVEAQQQAKADVSSVEIAVSGGAMVAPELVRSVRDTFHCDFQTVYGQTEASPLVTQHYHDDTIEDICSSIGQPMPMTEVSIRTTDTNSVVPVDTVGEICVRGYCTMLSYHANPQATQETIDAEGWLHTGDLGAMDKRGYLRITGRVKEMIIRGGENLFPAEIENALLEHPHVAEVAVVGLPDPKWGEIVACFVRSEGGQGVDPQVLKAHSRERLSPQKAPAVWFHVTAFPLTGSGKIRKFSLRDDYLAGKHEPL